GTCPPRAAVLRECLHGRRPASERRLFPTGGSLVRSPHPGALSGASTFGEVGPICQQSVDDDSEVSRQSPCGLSGLRAIPGTRDYPGTGDLADHPFETGLLPCKTGFFASWRTLMRLTLA